ncbi:unnamed protein product, partial [Mesorhabditis belari]|uniref:non-specific serine/threonine protein kinase n=1 Tax=Mesorhabditis belari TaxID=2138241 RepID=A0AAF3FKK5_9BILA
MNDQSIIKIGEGGYGDAFLLIKYKPPLVMKVVDEIQNLEKQEAEMRILKSLVHENIVRFKDQPLDFVYAGPGFPIFMEFCGEGSLRKVITDVILSYSMASVVKWGREIFIVLEYLQSKRIVHRDIKPDNIFLTEDFDLKVGDFGVFEKFDSNNQFYKCDVYAAGLVLWEMIMRRDWNKTNGYMEFPSVTSVDVAGLFELIKNCSSANTNINDRYDVEDALNQLEIIKKSFSSLIAKPERKRHQTFLLDVEEIGCFDCLKEYIGLTYVYLSELGILLEIMQRFLRGWLDEFTYTLDDVDESEYCKAMRTAIENFWKTRELL